MMEKANQALTCTVVKFLKIQILTCNENKELEIKSFEIKVLLVYYCLYL